MIHKTRNAGKMNRILQKRVLSELVDIDISMERLKSLKKYFMSIYLLKGREKHKRQSLFSFLGITKGLTKEEIAGKLRRKCEGTPFRDIENLSSRFWAEVAAEINVSHYTCYNIWLNKIKGLSKDKIFTKFEDELIVALAGKERGWEKIGLAINKSPVLALKRYRALCSSGPGGEWTEDEDRLLRLGIETFGYGKWKLVASHVGSKTQKQCLHRARTKKFNLQERKRWSWEEDRLLVRLVQENDKNWAEISRKMPGRTGASCRERYTNILDPTLKRSLWKESEDRELLSAVEALGTNRWALVSKRIKGRSNKDCRRRYFTLLKAEKSTQSS